MTALADPAASERDAELPKSGAKKPAGKRELVQTRAEETRERILDAAYEAFAKQGFEDRIYVRGHKQVDYGRVASVMATITSAGFKRVALVTEPNSH